ncbi:methyltransferase domain-containing protein [Nocardia sp. CDC159]|uniref:Methyltransferase domain-containing protein n=1 Tax=Nocardia pulmonis TaxID=2951408 RepID=A0A9X2ECC1_9NOCA|nr:MULTISPECIES: methyltransferase domain-containing protein [Nocardia]MCM6775603.1 methyltransferase domain-containing protein [Nocardia pulmonis]MCM6787663.1 methyltransferase domain-containing protein [Nocardia sp. CDC159]
MTGSLDTQAIYSLTHRQIANNEAAQEMMAYLWRDWGGYVGQLSWVTAAQLAAMAEAAGLAPGRAALDLCCGTGGITRHLVATTGATMTGLDYSEPAIEIARRDAAAVPAIRFDHGDARELPYGTAEFDAVISVDSLVIVPDRRQVLAECARVLKAGGRLVFSDEVLTGPVPRDPETQRALAVYGRLFPLTAPGYRRLLVHLGFTEIEIHDRTPMFVAINRRWADSYRRFEESGRKVLGDRLFEDGLAFFDTLHAEGAAGRLGQVLVSATWTGHDGAH